jgi:hypothetical protein
MQKVGKGAKHGTPVVGKVQGAARDLGAVAGRQRLHQRAPA